MPGGLGVLAAVLGLSDVVGLVGTTRPAPLLNAGLARCKARIVLLAAALAAGCAAGPPPEQAPPRPRRPW